MLSLETRILDWLDTVHIPTSHDRTNSASGSPFNLSKKRKLEISVMEADNNFDASANFDANATPRAPRPKKARSQGNTGPTPPTSFPPSDGGDTYSTTSSVSLHTRSSSPTKRKRTLATSTPQVVFEQRSALRSHRAQLEAERPMLKELGTAIRAANLNLPNGLKNYFDETWVPEDGARPNFAHAGNEFLDKFSNLEKFIRKTTRRVDFCKNKDVSEDEWCDLVVYPCLKTAAKSIGIWTPERVVRVTNYYILPQRLLPNDSFGNSITCRTDFALGQSPSPVLQLSQVPDQSLSQYTHKRLSSLALFATVEVKRTVSSGDGLDQLAVWCAAGFAKLAELRHGHRMESRLDQTREPSKAILCLWAWRGHMVSLHIAVEESAEKIVMYEWMEWNVGVPDNLVRLITTFAAVMQWGSAHFVPDIVDTTPEHVS